MILSSVRGADRTSLVDSYLARILLLDLGHADAQNTIVETGLDLLLVDRGGEVEGPLEMTKRALRDPESLGRLLLLLLLLVLVVLDHFGFAAILLVGRIVLILDRGLVGTLVVLLLLLLTTLGDGGFLVALDVAGRGSTRGVGALGVAADHQGLRVGELDVDVVTIEAGELAVELVAVLGLVQVELGAHNAGVAATVGARSIVGTLIALDLASVVIKIAEQAEQGSEARVGDTAREESHCDCCCCGVWMGYREKRSVVELFMSWLLAV